MFTSPRPNKMAMFTSPRPNKKVMFTTVRPNKMAIFTTHIITKSLASLALWMLESYPRKMELFYIFFI